MVLVSAQEKQCIAPTLSWLGNHKFSFDEIHFTKNKETVDIDILVDDYDKNLINFSNIGKLAICFSHPYNKDIQDLFITISSLKELPAVVDTIEAEKNLVDTVATMA